VTPRVVSVTPPATDEEVAAIVAALAVVESEQRAAAAASSRAPEQLSMWVEASRRSAQRAGLQRGSWRLSGRVARRARA
jgi:hypothetical protein